MNGIGSTLRAVPRNNAVAPGPPAASTKKAKPAIPGMHRSASKPRAKTLNYDGELVTRSLNSTRAETLPSPKARPVRKIQKDSRLSKSYRRMLAKAHDSKTFIINPKDSNSVLWDIFMGVLIAYSGVTVPLIVCFPGFQTSSDWTWANGIIDVCFGIDIIRNFLVGYHDERDELVVNHKEIAKKYLKTWFLLDIVSTIPIESITTYFGNQSTSHSFSSIQLFRILRVARIIKLTRLAKLQAFFAKAETAFGFNAGMVRLVRLVLYVLFISHLLACFFHLLGQPNDPPTREPSENPPVTWLCPPDVRMRCVRWESDSVRYLYSLYWVITTLTGVGFGDVVLVNVFERMYAILAMIIGASVFGFVIGNISTLLESMDKRAAMYQMKMMLVKDYIRNRNLPNELRHKLKRYFEHYLSRASLFDESSILGELSLSLRNEIVHETCKDIFQIPAFSLINPQFVMDMAVCIKPLFLLADSVIAKEHTVGREMYFLNSGVVAMYNSSLNGKRILLEVMSENAYFGEAALLYFALRENTFQSVTNCDMYTLLKEDFDVLVEEYPETEGILIEFYEHRKQLYQETLDMTMKRYALYEAMKDDEVKMSKFEDYCPHLKVCYNGKLTAIEQLPMEILRNIDFNIAPKVSLFNSSFAKKVIVDGIQNQVLYSKNWRARISVIIGPHNSMKLRWDVWLGILIFYNVISIPIQVAFQGTSSGDDPALGDVVKSYMDIVIDGFFALDILLTFRTGYYDSQGNYIESSFKIAKHYCHVWFWVDFVSTFPFGYVINNYVGTSTSADGTTTQTSSAVPYQNFKLIRFARLIRLLKLARLLKFNKSFGSVENVINLSPAATRLLMLFLQVCMIAHLSSCAFFFVGATSNDLYDGMSWISDQGLNNATLGEKYVLSLYFAFTTMATVGYGDILPISHLEVAYVIFYMLVGASVFGYIIGSMSSLVDQMQTKSMAAKEKMNRVKDYMKERRLPKPLCNRIRRYFEFYMSQKEIADESAFLDDLSDDLRTQLVLHLNRDVVSKISFFSHQDDACISYLMGILYQECCTPGEYIFYEGEYGRHMYFLVKGTVEVVINAGTAKEITCKVLTEGSFFGELAMLLSSKRCASVRAKTFGILYVLSRNGMERIRTHYPDISNQITREIRSKLQKIKADTLAQPNAGQMAGHIPDEENFTKEMEKPIRDSITMIDRALSTLMGYYGDGEKGKRRSIACVILHLKKFEFAHRDEIGHSTDAAKLQPPV
ncbi:Potassium voltage-gated channel sub H member 5 [Aphanomyces cochlioides]|nr:Potassium voltage-gated channel sub H member 5 [Aphanomyces cochlioides]